MENDLPDIASLTEIEESTYILNLQVMLIILHYSNLI